LTGIHPVVNGKIIRPLIAVRRAALRQWLADHREKWREDASNQDLRFTRNRIRSQLLPLLSEFNPRIVETLARTAALAREEEAFWESYLGPLRENLVRWEADKAILNLERLREQPPAVAYRLLRWTIGRISDRDVRAGASRPGPVYFLPVQRLLQWALQGQSGQVFLLPRKLEARKEFSHLILASRSLSAGPDVRPESADYDYPIRVPSSVDVPEAGVSLSFEFITLGAGQARYNERGIILLDGKLAGSPLSLRNWRAGDAYQQQGHRNPKKLQDLFQRKRIPFRERAGWPVLLSGERIIWVRGLAVAEGCSPSLGSSEAIGIRETGAE
jgi:tRNA(Ile)-lysidine synthase